MSSDGDWVFIEPPDPTCLLLVTSFDLGTFPGANPASALGRGSLDLSVDVESPFFLPLSSAAGGRTAALELLFALAFTAADELSAWGRDVDVALPFACDLSATDSSACGRGDGLLLDPVLGVAADSSARETAVALSLFLSLGLDCEGGSSACGRSLASL